MNCPACGFKIEPYYKSCPECGLRLSDKRISKNIGKVISNKKELPTKTITILIVGGILFTVLIMYVSGLFRGPEIDNISLTNISNQNDAQRNQIDLNNISRINELEQKIKNNPEDHKSLLDLANLKMDSGLFEQAIQTYKQYLKIHPKDANAIVDMAVCYFNLQNYETALSYMKDALKIEPKHQIAHLNIGVVTLTMGNVSESKEWFKKAVQIDPNSEAGKKAKQLLTSH